MSRRRFTDIEDRFWSKVAKGGPDDCWPWTASKNAGGYGYFGKDGRLQRAHRVAFTLSGGTIQPTEVVCHKCDNPPCCNPAHLWAGTRKDNTRDMYTKGRAGNPSQPGEKHGGARLTVADVQAIRASKLPQRKIAAHFGVGQAAISMIKNGKRWKNGTP